MDINEKMADIEAILFAAGEPVPAEVLAQAGEVEPEVLPRILALLSDRYEETHSALQILRLEQSYQLATRPIHMNAIKRAMETKRNAPLSPAAMETLTIVAYNQPVTKSFVEHVRGIDSSSVVNTLVERDLLMDAGRLDVPGKPIAYRTTPRFLRCFGLNSLDDLPPLPNKNPQHSMLELDPDEATSAPEEPSDNPESD